MTTLTQSGISGIGRAWITRSAIVVAMFVLSGCAVLYPDDPPPPPPPELPPNVEPDPEIVPEPVAEPEPDPEPPQPDPEPPVIEPLVAVVLSDRTPAYVEVATALAQYLDRHEVYDLSDRSQGPKDAFAAISESGAYAVVAIGLPAATAASRFSTVPVVVGQVFNFGDDELLSDDVKAVAVLPPIDLQLDAWQRLDPSLRNVGAIVGPGHDALIEEADRAMKERGIKFHYAVAESDRETLYLFNRLIRDIDGFILFPDNRILSRPVLAEMMTYATRHRVQVAVYNEPLLDFGALFSATSVEADIAAKIASVLKRVEAGDFEDVPAITTLSEIDLRTNPAVLQRLGLEQVAMHDDAGSAQ